MKIDHSFLIPLYNEESNIVNTMSTILSAAKETNLNFEIIVIDDASTDNSYKIVTNYLKNHENIICEKHSKNLGFAKSYQYALRLCQGQTCQYIPSDNTIRKPDLIKLLSAAKNCQVVLQYPTNPNQRKYYRALISNTYTKFLNILHKKTIFYYNGLNIYPTSFVRNNINLSNSFAFQAELTIKASNQFRFVQQGTHCIFKDDTSSALTLSNITKVSLFLIRQTIRRILEFAKV